MERFSHASSLIARHDGAMAIRFPTTERTGGGELNAAVSRAVVQIHRTHVGRGPTKAHAFYRHDVVVVVLEDILTTAERTLVAHSSRDTAMAARRAVEHAMRDDLIAAIEGLTGAHVRALMHDTQPRPDMSSLVFVLDRPVDPALAPLAV
jgi:uncharacterized protein YbcI